MKAAAGPNNLIRKNFLRKVSQVRIQTFSWMEGATGLATKGKGRVNGQIVGGGALVDVLRNRDRQRVRARIDSQRGESQRIKKLLGQE